MRKRIVARTGDASEARLDVLDHQIKVCEPLDAVELGRAVLVDSSGEIDIGEVVAGVRDAANAEH